MEKITLNRNELYEKVWSKPISELCEVFDIDRRGLEQICDRLAVPYPERDQLKKFLDGKKTVQPPLPTKSKGTETVTLFEKDDDKLTTEQTKQLEIILHQVCPSKALPKDLSFDRLVLSTREGFSKGWEEKHDKYTAKSKLLDLHVSPEVLPRALQFMDLFIKALRFKGHELIVEIHDMFAFVDGERVQISLREKNKRVEYINNFNHVERDNRPTGLLFLKKEKTPYESIGWADGPKKGMIEGQVPVMISDLEEMAVQIKVQREENRKSEEERQQREKVKREQEERQRKELARFRHLLLNSHRFQLANEVRNYVTAVEATALQNGTTEEITEWISWARKRADWYDPSIPREKGDLLEGIDIEELQTNNNYYPSFSAGYGETENKFWKPWWLK